MNENTISSFTVGTLGSLIPNGPDMPTGGTQPNALAVDTTHHYLYVANYTDDLAGSVSEFAIGPTGTLSPLATPTIPAGVGPKGITVNGNNVYVANYGDGTVSQYTIGTSGQLSLTAIATAGTGAAGVTLNPAGTFAFVPNFAAGTVSVFSVASMTGTLTLASTAALPANSNPFEVLMHPTGDLAYVGSGGNILLFQIGADGALTPQSLPTPSVTAGGTLRGLTLNTYRTLSFIYAANAGLDAVQQFVLDPQGPTPVVDNFYLGDTRTLAAGTEPSCVVIDPAELYAYVTDPGGGNTGLVAPFGNSISQFFVLGNGFLATPTVTSGTTTQSEPACIVITTAY